MLKQVTINAVPMMGDMVVPAVMHISHTMPDIQITYRSTLDMADLSDGCTIGVRAGVEPSTQEMEVSWLGRIGLALVAAPEYIAQRGKPSSPADLAQHVFASNDFSDAGTPWSRWLHEVVPTPNIVFRTDDETLLRQAIKSGRCAGFLPISSLCWSAELVEILPAREEWALPLWLVRCHNASEACVSVGAELADMMSRQLF
ncbi:LysR substrate-binding domain-containing protein [Paracoccus sediminicola]|uniref:LysR substrate-binding domain-containing protein n=1 Tax=Paracoccus sediminicola TaxID=3017783 RepID=UPI0022F088AA|nr:LysR substrate-binding domain-containing protein [Paracoccus sediminicola]WBU57738.1 LysR substrate-binding domain-containing protein [Paracoccus sediminicola]